MENNNITLKPKYRIVTFLKAGGFLKVFLAWLGVVFVLANTPDFELKNSLYLYSLLLFLAIYFKLFYRTISLNYLFKVSK